MADQQVRIEVVGGLPNGGDALFMSEQQAQVLAVDGAKPGTFFRVAGRNYLFIGGKLVPATEDDE